MALVNPNFEVKMHAIPGTTVQHWVSPLGLSLLAKILNENKNLTHMWVSLGGNDMFQMSRVGKYSEYPKRVLNDFRVLLTVLTKASPNLKVSSLGYELLSFTRSQECMNWYRSTLKGIPIEKFRRDLIDNFNNILSTIQKEFPKNFYHIPVFGALQKRGGVPNAPNVKFSSPPQFYADCIHPNDAGWKILMEDFFVGLKKTDYFK